MRRFWAHLVLSFTAFAAIGTTTALTVSKMNSNIEYTSGKELIFKISNKGDEDTFLDDNATDEVVKVMEERLKQSDVSYYQITKSDTTTDRNSSYVKVHVSADSSTEYSQIAYYLTYDGTMALSDNSDANDNASLKEMMTSKAYTEAYNGYPAIIIPIDNAPSSTFDTLLNQAKENGTPETKTEGEGDDATTTSTTYLYMWYSFNAEKDSYVKTQETLSDGTENPEYDENVAARLSSIKFDTTDDNIFYPDGNKDKIYCVLNIGSGEDSESITMNDARNGFKTAQYLTNLINAEELDYKIEAVNASDQGNVNPVIESIKTSDQTIAWSRTLIATLCAILVISLLLVVFFKLSALSIGTISLLASYLSLVIMIALNAEFSTVALTGIILVTVASLISGVIYANKMKEECYKGRTLKKANSEAAKKSLLPTLDIHLIIIVIGGFAYLFGGALFRSFGFVTIVGGIISFFLCTFGLRGLMWLNTNTTKFIGRYDLFGVEKTQVPNHLEEEKQKYFGPFENKDFTKKKKPFAIVGGVLALASLVGVITFGVLNNGVIFNKGNTTTTSEVYFLANSRNSEDNPFGESTISTLIENTKVYTSDASSAKSLKNYVTNFSKDFSSSVTSFTYVDKPDNTEGESEVNIYYFYYTVKLNSVLDGSKVYAYAGDVIPTTPVTLNEYLQTVAEESFINGQSFVYQNSKVVPSYPSWTMVSLATFVATATMMVYFALRYRLSRGLTSILVPFVACLIPLGIITLSRVTATSYAAMAIPVIAAFAMMISVIFMNKEREMFIEDRTRDNSIEARNALMIRANSLAFNPVLISTILTGYLAINFFGFGASGTSTMFLVMILGILVSIGFVGVLYGPTSQVLFKFFKRFTLNDNKPSKNKKKKKVVHKSAEPEEATFIGIND